MQTDYAGLLKRYQEVDATSKGKKRKVGFTDEHTERIEKSDQAWTRLTEQVTERIQAVTRLLHDSELLGLSLEAAVGAKEELLVLWDVIDDLKAKLGHSVLEVTQLTERISALEDMVNGLHQERQILACRLVATNVDNKLTRLSLTSIKEPKKAKGYSLNTLLTAKKTDKEVLKRYVTKYPELIEGLGVLRTAGNELAHRPNLLDATGKELVWDAQNIEECFVAAFGEDHPAFEGMQQVICALQELATELDEDLIVSTL